MPKVVNADERRAALVEAAGRQIAERGLAKVTLRSIAGVHGWSTGMITHYFADKHELLIATFTGRADRSRREIESRTAQGEALLPAAIEAVLPTDEERRLDWRVYLAYMSEAIGEPMLLDRLRQRQVSYLATLVQAFDEEIRAGRLPASLDSAYEAERLLSVLNGVCVGAVLDPERFPPERQRRIVDDHLRGISCGD